MLRRTHSIALAACVLLVLPLRRTSSAELASMPVSLVVQESCLIQSDDALLAPARPLVSCLHGQPFNIEQSAVEPAAALAAQVQPVNAGALIAAAPNAAAPSKVWMVMF
ncbi:hypothetical protein [Paraburkholderia sp.]|uniref:hypothetical protein n=1 Tax=Paraburkholderia sp. TaxID=1926495 RepID=UPI002393E3B1|nr:hypothetical protein [Paraburkholderia sp.]MDE1182789.1 hypothetical protein [Paraburkholderia sp.]